MVGSTIIDWPCWVNSSKTFDHGIYIIANAIMLWQGLAIVSAHG